MLIIQPNKFELAPNPPFHKVRVMGLALWGFWDSDLKALLWPGLVSLFSCLILMLNLVRRSNFKKESWIFWLLIMWAALFSVIPWSNAQDFRYALLSYLIAQIIILVTLAETFIHLKQRIK